MSDLLDLKPLGAALLNMEEAERYRLLSTLLATLSEQVPSGPAGQGHVSAEQLGQLARKIQQLDQDKANLEDELKTARANLVHREKQLQAEQRRAQELEQVVEDKRQRLVTLQAELNQAQTQLVARNSEVHQLEAKRDTLALELQRAAAEKGDRATLNALEQARRQLTQQVSDLQGQLEQARADKDAQAEQLRAQLQAAQNKPVRVEENILATAWQRLTVEVPPLAPRGVPPTKEVADRLVETFIEMFHFAQGLDEDMRPLLTRYTHWDESLKLSWKAYASQKSLSDLVHQTIAPPIGKNVTLLRHRLNLCRQWLQAALWSNDIAIESIPQELQSHLLGGNGGNADPKRTVRDFVKGDGAERFKEVIRGLREKMLAEVREKGGIS